MGKIGTLAGGVAFMLLGGAIAWGAVRRWDWLVDPPVETWPFYSQALLKKLFGTRAVVYITFVEGVALAILAGLGMFAALSR
ncbi:MAG: hypothetical protein ACREQI_06310 [Candidatus Binataceae bacterium]